MEPLVTSDHNVFWCRIQLRTCQIIPHDRRRLNLPTSEGSWETLAHCCLPDLVQSRPLRPTSKLNFWITKQTASKPAVVAGWPDTTTDVVEHGNESCRYRKKTLQILRREPKIKTARAPSYRNGETIEQDDQWSNPKELSDTSTVLNNLESPAAHYPRLMETGSTQTRKHAEVINNYFTCVVTEKVLLQSRSLTSGTEWNIHWETSREQLQKKS